MDEPRRLSAGLPVVFVDEKGRVEWDVLEAGGQTRLRNDVVAHDDVIGQPDGGLVRSRRDKRFRVLSSTLVQQVQFMPKHTSLIWPKDAALLVTWGDVKPGDRVVEGGLGSGALTLALLRAVGPSGSVTTYELREESINRSVKNVRSLFGGTPANHTVRHASIYEGIEERDVDLVVLDVPEPWDALPHAAVALRNGGVFASYVVGATQMQRIALALDRIGCFALVECLESLVRPWAVSARSVRPELQMIGHTGFLVFARRTTGTPRPLDERPPEDEAD